MKINSKNKKAKGTKRSVIKRKHKFEDYKTCVEATQFEIKINHLEKNKIYMDSLKEDHEEFIKSKTLISKAQQRFRSEKYNVFTEELIKLF